MCKVLSIIANSHMRGKGPVKSTVLSINVSSSPCRHGQGGRVDLLRGAHPGPGEGGGGREAEDAAQREETAAQEPRVLPGESVRPSVGINIR